MASVLLLAVIAAVIALLATFALRRPRLRVSLSLRGGTRDGTLYVVVENRGRTAAHRVRVRTEWLAPDAAALIDERDLGTIAAHDAVRIEARDIQRAMGERREGWTSIAASLRASNAMPARGSIALQGRPGGGRQQAPPVAYVSEVRCPDAADGRHRLERQEFLNDGVRERWEVCRACRYVRRLPLTTDEEAVQARIRAERAVRERASMEAEWARAEARHEPRPRRATPDEPGDLPLAVAYWVLGVSESATWDEVLAAHRKLAMEHHPDRAHGADARVRAALEARMQEINRARDRLRERYAGQA